HRTVEERRQATRPSRAHPRILNQADLAVFSQPSGVARFARSNLRAREAVGRTADREVLDDRPRGRVSVTPRIWDALLRARVSAATRGRPRVRHSTPCDLWEGRRGPR